MMMKHWLILILITCFACKQDVNNKPYQFAFRGETMGTYYQIKYYSHQSEELKPLVEKLLREVNQSLSTYIDTSTISKVNRATGTIAVDHHFRNNFLKAKDIYHETNGAFNPAVMPLVNYWGFGYKRLQNNETIDTAKVAELLQLVDFDSFELTDDHLIKHNPKAELDFSSLAKGYGVDVIAEALLNRGLDRFMIDIGGEVRAHGKKSSDEFWKVGIRKPELNADNKQVIVQAIPLLNRSMATSGNYENYKHLEDGKTISHTINPNTGFPQEVEAEILSSTVIANDCMTADAYATAFKVMGFELSKEFMKNQSDLDAFFIYLSPNNEVKTWSTIKLDSTNGL